MEVALLSHQFMVVAPQLYPRHKILQPIEVEACGPPELLLYVWHVIHWAPFLDAQCLLLVQEEVCKEFISQPYPLCLLIGGDVILVVDLEHMLQVLSPSCAMVFGGQSCGITGRSPCPTASLRWGTFRCCGWGNVWCCPGGEITLLTRRLPTCLLLHSPEATGRLATVSPPSSPLSPMVLREDMGSIGAHWAVARGPCAICAQVCLSTVALICMDILMPGRPWEEAGSPWGRGALEGADSNWRNLEG